MNYTNKLIGCQCGYCRTKAVPIKAIAMAAMIAAIVGLALLLSQ